MIRPATAFKSVAGRVFEARTGREVRLTRGAWRCVVEASDDPVVHPAGSVRWIEVSLEARHRGAALPVTLSGPELNGRYEATKEIVHLGMVTFREDGRIWVHGWHGARIVLRPLPKHAERVVASSSW